MPTTSILLPRPHFKKKYFKIEFQFYVAFDTHVYDIHTQDALDTAAATVLLGVK